jgi:hypothetical protein
VVDLAKGCHTGAFFAAQQPPSLAFLARHLQPSAVMDPRDQRLT